MCVEMVEQFPLLEVYHKPCWIDVSGTSTIYIECNICLSGVGRNWNSTTDILTTQSYSVDGRVGKMLTLT